MKLVFALIVMIDGTVDAEATSYWHDLKDVDGSLKN
jgi:hypothetical protein